MYLEPRETHTLKYMKKTKRSYNKLKKDIINVRELLSEQVEKVCIFRMGPNRTLTLDHTMDPPRFDPIPMEVDLDEAGNIDSVSIQREIYERITRGFNSNISIGISS